ncbi:ArsR/SmtB family transcription factor [Streptomyces sp. SBT349]|uniref:ArsR/SmtB family transcription factor n=1 Tax=Streptomyces sp. SBT349 TaxID=1580539 RepID=UPI00069E8DC6|nr:winged helix-turn-helix domain-containing protein [Streptomyces sp. SBT349]
MRALAHPVRVQLLGLLRRFGPATATQLARRLGLTSGATSYHLRQLDAAGFVEEDAQRGNARDRWWRSVHRATRLKGRELSEREPEATMTYLRSVAAAYAVRVQEALNELETMPEPWRDVFTLSDRFLYLTPDQATRLKDELGALIARHTSEATASANAAPPGARRVSIMTHFLPDLDDQP